MRRRFEAPATALVAVVAWCGLGLQFWLTGSRSAIGFVNFFSFFTVLTNLLVAAVATARLIGRRTSWLAATRVSGATAAYIAFVGISYSVFLRNVWDPQGWQRVADVILHDVVPALFALYWLVIVPKGTLRASDVAAWLVYPLIYLAGCLGRGAITGWYPYWFIDVSRFGYLRVAVNAAGFTLAFAVLGAVIVAVDRTAPSDSTE